MIKLFLSLTLLIFSFFVLNAEISFASSPQIFDGGEGLLGIVNEIINFFKSIVEPIKTIIQFLGKFIIEVLGLLIKLIEWGLSYL